MAPSAETLVRLTLDEHGQLKAELVSAPDAIPCEFRRIAAEGTRHLGRVALTTIPAVDERIDLDGDFYVVRDRSWTIKTTDGARPGASCVVWLDFVR